MPAEFSENSACDPHFEEALVACLEGKEDREAIRARYPEFAKELEEFFASHDLVDELAAPLRQDFKELPELAADHRPIDGLADTVPQNGAAWPVEVFSWRPGMRIGGYDRQRSDPQTGRGESGRRTAARTTAGSPLA